MSETHSLKLEINASAAKRGAADFEGAIRRIDSAVKNLDKSSDKAFSNIQRNVGKVNFSALARAIGSLNSININPRLVTNLRNISTAINGMKAVSPNTIATIRQLSLAINSMAAASANIRQINTLARALNNIKAPPAGAAAGINLIANAVRNLRTPANTSAIVSSLTSIANAANATYTALHRLGSLNVNVRQPRVSGGGGGGGGAINPVTGRAYGGVRPGYGFGPGRSSASGLRGFENVSNLSYQAGSAVRTAVGGLTAGAALSQITNVTRETERFRIALESVGATAQEARTIQDNLGESSVRLGLDFRSVQEQSRGFISGALAAGVSVQDASGMFDDFTIAMRASGLGMQQTEGSLRAMTQMFGKGRIQAEELRQQMAEHWSSFGPLLARYLYPQIADAQERMRRLTEDISKRSLNPRVLIGFARSLRGQLEPMVEQQANSLDAAVLRVGSAWALLMKELGEGEAGKALAETFNRFTEILRDPVFRQFAQDVGVGLANVLRSVGDMAVWASQHLELIKYALTALLAIGSVNFFIGLARAASVVVQPFIAVGRAIGVLRGGTAAVTPTVSILVTVLRTLGTVATGLFAAISAHPFVAIGVAIAAVIAYFVDWKKVITDVISAWPAIVESFRTGLDMIGGFFSYQAGMINDVFITPLKELATWVGTSFVQAFVWLKNAIKDAFDPNNMSPFAQGLQSLTNKVAELAAGLGAAIVRATQGPNQVASPGVGGLLSRTPSANGTGSAPRPISGMQNPDPTAPTPGDIMRRNAQLASDARRRAALTPGGDGPDAGGMGSAGSRELIQPPSANPPVPSDDPSSFWGAGRGSGSGGGGRNGRESVENYFGRLDQAYGVLEKLHDGEVMLQRARQMGIGTAEERTRWEGMIRDSLFETLGAVDPVSQATRRYEASMRALDGLEANMPGRIEEINAARRRLAATTEEARDPVGYMLRQGQEEIDLLNNRNGVYEDEVALLRIRNQLRGQGIILEGQQEDAVRSNIRAQREANQAYKDSQEGLASWANSFRDIGTELRKLEEKFLNQFADALTELVMTGKTDWRSLATSIVTDINQLIIKQGIRELLKALGLIDGNTTDGFKNQGSGLLGGVFGGSSTNNGGGSSGGRGILGEVMGGIGGLFSSGGGGGVTNATAWSNLAATNGADAFGPAVPVSGGASGGGWISSIASIVGSLFTSGAVAKEGFSPGSSNNISAMLPAHAFVGAPRFAEGGVTSGGMPAILHPNEAVVPLSRGRKIAIEGGGGGGTTNIFNVQTPDADSFRRSSAQVLKKYSQGMANIQRRGG